MLCSRKRQLGAIQEDAYTILRPETSTIPLAIAIIAPDSLIMSVFKANEWEQISVQVHLISNNFCLDFLQLIISVM